MIDCKIFTKKESPINQVNLTTPNPVNGAILAINQSPTKLAIQKITNRLLLSNLIFFTLESPILTNSKNKVSKKAETMIESNAVNLKFPNTNFVGNI